MLTHKGPLQNFDVNRLEEQLVRRDRRRLYVAFGAAILLHASSVVGFTYWTPPEPVAPPGDMVITIDLAPAVYSTATEATAGESAESAPQIETEPVPEPEEPEVVEPLEPEPPEPPKEEVVEEQPVPEPPKEEVVEEQPVPEPPPEAETVQEKIETPPPAEEPAVALSPKKVEKPKPKPKVAKKKQKTATANSQAAASASQQRSDVGGSGAKASPSDMAKFVGRLRAALERAKRYPAAAGGASGTASLRFTISRSGAITGFAIVKSSGNAALDAATRQMIQNASLPSIPAGLPDSITIGVPVNFRVR